MWSGWRYWSTQRSRPYVLIWITYPWIPKLKPWFNGVQPCTFTTASPRLNPYRDKKTNCSVETWKPLFLSPQRDATPPKRNVFAHRFTTLVQNISDVFRLDHISRQRWRRASGGSCIPETARLHNPLFARRGDIHPCALFRFPLGLLTVFSEQQLHPSLHLIARSLFPHGLQ